MSAAAERLAAAAARHGVPHARYLAETDSTNRDLEALARAGAPHGTWVFADAQRAGRGRLGRTWLAPPGVNLTFSVLVHPRAGLARAPLICLGAAVAVAEAAGESYRIKWPNDVLDARGRKVAGILAEVASRPDEGHAVIVGIGVNVGLAPDAPNAGCLSDDGVGRERADLAAAIVAGVLARAADTARDPAAVLHRWRARADTLGREVAVAGLAGTAVDIDADGALLVRTAEGVRRVLAGDVQMIG